MRKFFVWVYEIYLFFHKPLISALNRYINKQKNQV